MSEQAYDVIMFPAMRKIFEQGVYLAYEAGEISDDDYSDAMNTLRGVARNPECDGRAFHRNVAHVCEVKGY